MLEAAREPRCRAHRPHLDERGLRDGADASPSTRSTRCRRSRRTPRRRSAPTSSRSRYQRSFETPVVDRSAVQHLRAAAERAGGDPDDHHPGAVARRRSSSAPLDPTRDFLYVEDTVAGIMRCGRGRRRRGRGDQPRHRRRRSRSARSPSACSSSLGRDVPSRLDEDRLRPPDSEVERLVAGTAQGEAPARLGARGRPRRGPAPDDRLADGLARRLQAVDLQRLKQRLDHRRRPARP